MRRAAGRNRPRPRPRFGACGMPGSVMHTATWSGFFDLSGCHARSKKSNRPYHVPIEDEDDDEDEDDSGLRRAS